MPTPKCEARLSVVLGGATQHVLENAEIPVLMSR